MPELTHMARFNSQGIAVDIAPLPNDVVLTSYTTLVEPVTQKKLYRDPLTKEQYYVFDFRGQVAYDPVTGATKTIPSTVEFFNKSWNQLQLAGYSRDPKVTNVPFANIPTTIPAINSPTDSAPLFYIRKIFNTLRNVEDNTKSYMDTLEIAYAASSLSKSAYEALQFQDPVARFSNETIEIRDAFNISDKHVNVIFAAANILRAADFNKQPKTVEQAMAIALAEIESIE